MLPIVQEESSRFDFLNPRCACCIQKERGRIIVLLLAAVNVRDCYKDALLWAEGVPAWELARPTHSVLQGATGAMLGCTVLRYIHSLDRDHTAYYKNPGGAWLCWETTNTADGPTGPALEERSIQTQRWAALSEVANMRWIWCQSDSQGLRPKANHNQNGFLMIPDDSCQITETFLRCSCALHLTQVFFWQVTGITKNCLASIISKQQTNSLAINPVGKTMRNNSKNTSKQMLRCTMKNLSNKCWFSLRKGHLQDGIWKSRRPKRIIYVHYHSSYSFLSKSPEEERIHPKTKGLNQSRQFLHSHPLLFQFQHSARHPGRKIASIHWQTTSIYANKVISL